VSAAPARPRKGLRRGLRRALVAQFQRPHGALGHVAGLIMTLRGSNRARNRWSVELLDLQPEDRVLELGCGPGLALAHARLRAHRGLVVGVDHSRAMLRQARLRSRLGRGGPVALRLGSVDDLPALPGPFDALLAVNSLMWSDDPEVLLRRLAGLLRPGGRMAVTFQSRRPGAGDADSRRMGEEVAARMRRAGLEAVRAETLPLEPVCAVCVLAQRPRADAGAHDENP